MKMNEGSSSCQIRSVLMNTSAVAALPRVSSQPSPPRHLQELHGHLTEGDGSLHAALSLRSAPFRTIAAAGLPSPSANKAGDLKQSFLRMQPWFAIFRGAARAWTQLTQPILFHPWLPFPEGACGRESQSWGQKSTHHHR